MVNLGSPTLSTMGPKVKFYEEDGILIREFYGELNFSDVFESWRHLIENNILTENHLGVLNDFKKARLNVNLEELDELMSLFKEHKNIFEKVKIAVVMVAPDQVILPMFAKDQHTKFKIRPFATNEAALSWIKDDLSK